LIETEKPITRKEKSGGKHAVWEKTKSVDCKKGRVWRLPC
jgi:hypothetical protein